MCWRVEKGGESLCRKGVEFVLKDELEFFGRLDVLVF